MDADDVPVFRGNCHGWKRSILELRPERTDKVAKGVDVQNAVFGQAIVFGISVQLVVNPGLELDTSQSGPEQLAPSQQVRQINAGINRGILDLFQQGHDGNSCPSNALPFSCKGR